MNIERISIKKRPRMVPGRQKGRNACFRILVQEQKTNLTYLSERCVI